MHKGASSFFKRNSAIKKAIFVIIMKTQLATILLILLFFNGCKKEDKIRLSGIDTIDNTIYGTTEYYAMGFRFSDSRLASTLYNPGPDITIDNDGTLNKLLLLTNSYYNSFYKVGDYANASAAEEAFNNLTEPTLGQWVVWAESIAPNQIWIYKTSTENYAKIRIISTVSELRGDWKYAECKFQWAYQPDGTLTFPGK